MGANEEQHAFYNAVSVANCSCYLTFLGMHLLSFFETQEAAVQKYYISVKNTVIYN